MAAGAITNRQYATMHGMAVESATIELDGTAAVTYKSGMNTIRQVIYAGTTVLVGLITMDRTTTPGTVTFLSSSASDDAGITLDILVLGF